MSLESLNINKDWTLFLDRDGVINQKRDNDYVKTIEEFIFLDGVIDAIKLFNTLFQRTVVVTNQQGIGKGIMTERNLEDIHGYMMKELNANNAHIDKAYFAPQLRDAGSIYRKPCIGMGAEAQKDFPEIVFSKSILIGDSESDIEFGINLGMTTIFLQNGRNEKTKANFTFDNLSEVANALK